MPPACKITHVPYRGAAPAVQDLIAGQIDGVVDNPPTVIAHIESRHAAAAGGGGDAAHDASARRADRRRGRRRRTTRRRPGSASRRRPARRRRSSRGCTRRSSRRCATPAMQERFAKSGARLVGNTPQTSSRRRSAPSARAGATSSAPRGLPRNRRTPRYFGFDCAAIRSITGRHVSCCWCTQASASAAVMACE